MVADLLRRIAPRVLGEVEDLPSRDESMALQCAVEKLDAWSRILAEAAGESNCHSHSVRWRHSSTKLIEAIRCSANLKGGAIKLQEVVEQAICLAAPSAIAGTLCRSFEQSRSGQRRSNVVPSPSTVLRAELSLDVALMLHRRNSYRAGEVVRFLWSDSSLVKGYDWLWAQSHEIRKSDLIATWRSAKELTELIRNHVAELKRRAPDDPPVYHPEPLPEWVPHLSQLLCIREHIFAPVSLALGHSGVPHKAAGLLHCWHLELPAGEPLRSMCSSFVSHTSDMGTEVGLPDFAIEDAEALIPDWISRDAMRPDVEVEGCDAMRPDVEVDCSVFMPNTLPIYGLQHLVNNLNCDVHRGLVFWPRFFPLLKNISKLFLCRGRRQRFIASCIRGTAYAARENELDHWRYGLYEKR